MDKVFCEEDDPKRENIACFPMESLGAFTYYSFERISVRSNFRPFLAKRLSLNIGCGIYCV